MIVWRSVAFVTLAWLGVVPARAAAQGGRTKVSYDVELSVQGSLLDRNCTASGTDVLVGTLVGLEPALPDEDNEYFGTLIRSTSIGICGTRRNAAGIDAVCNMRISGTGFPDVVLTVYAQGRGSYLQYLDNRARWPSSWPTVPTGTPRSTVTGTCEPAEMAHIQNTYDSGETAGSPTGQPIEMTDFPTSGFPVTFAPRPPESIWTLKVIARRP